MANRFEESVAGVACCAPSRRTRTTAPDVAAAPRESVTTNVLRFMSGRQLHRCGDRRRLGIRWREHRHVPGLCRTPSLSLRPHYNQTADRHERAADPDPNYERIERHPQLGHIPANAGEHHIGVELCRGANTHLGRWFEGGTL